MRPGGLALYESGMSDFRWRQQISVSRLTAFSLYLRNSNEDSEAPESLITDNVLNINESTLSKARELQAN